MFNERLTTFRYKGVDLCRVTLKPFKQFKSNRETTDRRTDRQRGIPLYAPVGHMKKDTRKEKQNCWPTWWAPSTIPTPRSLPPTISTSLAYCVLVKPTPSEIHHSTHSSLSLNSHCTEWSQNTCENKISELTIHSNINNTHVLTVNCFENINHV